MFASSFRWLATDRNTELMAHLAAITGLMLGSLRLPMMMRVLKLDARVAIGASADSNRHWPD